MHRVDVSSVFEAYEGLELLKLDRVKLPKLVWSCRSSHLLPKHLNYSDHIQLHEKVIVTGLCSYKGSDRPFLARLCTTFSIPSSGTADSASSRESLKQKAHVEAEVIKIIGGEDNDAITALEFGPYDNGYVLAGMQSGRLLVYDPVTLERVKDFKVFTRGKMRGELTEAEPISQISMEPTELVFVASSQGSVAALSIVKKELHYVYVDLGNRQFCTLAIPRGADDDGLDGDGFDHSPLRPVFDTNNARVGGICCI